MIPYGRQEITESDIAEVEKVLRSDFLTQGPAVPKFEEQVAGYCKASYAVAVNSATSALHIACLALGLGPVTVYGPHQIHLSLLQIVVVIVARI